MLGAEVEVADDWWHRLRGLLGRPPLKQGEGLLTSARAGPVHMYGMKFGLDVVFLSRDGRVVGLYEALAPNRLTPGDTRQVRGSPGPGAAWRLLNDDPSREEGPSTAVRLFVLSLVLVLQVLPGHFQIAFMTQAGVALMAAWTCSIASAGAHSARRPGDGNSRC